MSTLALGAGIKHLIPKLPNGWIPLIVTLAPALLGLVVKALTGLDLGNPIVNAALGGLAVAIHSTGKHALEGMNA